ncbi:ScyD/ScyE family protein [Cryobacterium sp. PH31-O1]|uniref:ScyD/ScyE family protein n=1 Tax=Cryobacterium sp. PH31-O1 TaxID=3046306 RepID=UPI0024BBC724|nr:ScyD/ScyE family protein [Cryobacterium sp. PH31-O1]MDJ0336729.1 ScyD/ScyE family protein [Cryobacterium sp. PH31-O1]
MKKLVFTAVACVTAVASAMVAAPASAVEIPNLGGPTVLASGLFLPLSLGVGAGGTTYVSQNALGVLTKVSPGGTSKVMASANPGDELGAVSVRSGTVYYSTNTQDHTASALYAMPVGGVSAPLADLYAYESTANPDQVNTYGFVDLPQACLDQFDPAAPTGPASYAGIVDTHPYASLPLEDAVYVADAGANAILRVGYDGTVSTAAVLPAGDPIMVTPEIAAGVGFPACTAGFGYRFEPVPTDVEQGGDGWLYVTSLPGGPEDASLGARGAVYRFNPADGEVQFVMGGFVGATDLAVSQRTGLIAVTELFGGPNGTGAVSVFHPTLTERVLQIPVSSPSAIELAGNSVYVTTNSFVADATGAPQPIGKVVKISVSLGGD